MKLLPLLACPIDGSPLLRPKDELVGASERYPVIAHVPILMPDPFAWLATHRDAVLASLAEVGLTTTELVERIDGLIGLRKVEPQRFTDDWVADEYAATTLPGTGGDVLRILAKEYRTDGVHAKVAAAIGPDPIVEIGCGNGPIGAWLGNRPRVSIDTSLRAVLRSGGIPVVADAEALPLRESVAGTIVAENLVDLLDQPEAFILGATRALKPGGRLILSTPDPSLGTIDDRTLEALIAEAGLEIVDIDDGVPWLRTHGPRHIEVYLVRIVVAQRPGRAR